jgi:hypothetical protein
MLAYPNYCNRSGRGAYLIEIACVRMKVGYLRNGIPECRLQADILSGSGSEQTGA